jgi:hypothetical protein
LLFFTPSADLISISAISPVLNPEREPYFFIKGISFFCRRRTFKPNLALHASSTTRSLIKEEGSRRYMSV